MNKVLIKYLRSFLLLLVILILFIAGSYWLIIRDFPTEGKTNHFIMKNGAMRVTGVLGLFLAAPWILAVLRNIVLLICDLSSNETVSVEINMNSFLDFYLPYHYFYVIDTFKFKNKLMFLFMYWCYVFSHSYFFMNMDMADIAKLRFKKKVHIVATKYSHVILSIQK